MNKIIFSLIPLVLCASAVAAKTDATTQLSNDLNATAPGYQSQTTSSISIAPRDSLIIATSVTRWDPKASDSLAIHWIAPKGGYCQSSNFPITRGPNTNHDVFWAYRTVVHTNSNGISVTCSGHWVAQVLNTANGKVLASASYDVPVQNKPPLSGDTTLPSAPPVDVSAAVSK